MGDRLFGEDVEMLYGVIQDDAGHSDAPQGIGHIDSGVGEIAGLIHHDLYRIDCFLQFFQESGGVRAVHLGVMKLEGDGQSHFEPMLAISAPGQEGIGVDAAVLVDDAVEFRASHCRRADYHRLIVNASRSSLTATSQKLIPPFTLSAITLMAIRSYLYSFPLCGSM